jgi:hypothetical protein
MDLYDDEFIKFWQALNNNAVKYIMVGGVATNMNGYQRTTDDINVWLKGSIENRERLRVAFREYGMGDFFACNFTDSGRLD